MRRAMLWYLPLVALLALTAACGRQGALVPPDGSPEDSRLTRYQQDMKREDAARQGEGLIDTDPLPDPDEDRWHREEEGDPPAMEDSPADDGGRRG